LDKLFDETIPNLCRFPQFWRAFLNCAIKSTKTEELVKRLLRLIKKNDGFLECLMETIFFLCLVRAGIVFLAVKHHQQLTSDLKHFWQRE